MAPILPQVPGLRLWLIWLAAAMALLLAKPWGAFSWDEWLVCAAPLLVLHRAVRCMDALVVGLVLASLAWITSGEAAGGWQELACLWSVLAIGIAVGFVATRTGESTEFLPLFPGAAGTEEVFSDALNRELCRARRHGRSFAVLSADRRLSSHETEERAARSLISMQKLLDSELHAYADIATIGDRVVAVVPEVSGVEYVQLLHRLAAKAVTQLGGEIRIGLARYPRDAVCAAELVEAADRDRLARGFALISGDGKSVAKRQVSP